MKLWKFLVVLAVGGALAAVLVAGINFLVLPSFVHSNKVVAVPDLRGASPQAAADLLRPLQLEVEVTRSAPHPSMRAGLIVDQVPSPKTGIRSGRVVKVVLSSGPATSAVPQVTGLSERQSQMTLERDGFRAGRVVHLRQAGQGEPEVVAQEPQAGTKLLRGTAVGLAVADPAPRATYRMPDLRGVPLARAKDLIEAAGLVLGRVENGRHGGDGGVVQEQRPRAGVRIGKGETVDLVASSR